MEHQHSSNNSSINTRRCVECCLEYSDANAQLFLLCDSCQQRGHLTKLSQQSFRFRKTVSAREQTERHVEMIRKMGQGRLSLDIEVFDIGTEGWEWMPSSESVSFVGLSIGHSSTTKEIAEKRQSEQKIRSNQRWGARVQFLKVFLVMTLVLGAAYIGWKEGWFVVDVDPFAVEQGADMKVPETLIQALTSSSTRGSNDVQDIELALMNQDEWAKIEQVLRLDLEKNPRQGTELLQWLQVKLLLYNSVQDDLPFPMEWLRFGLSLHHDAPLGHRLLSMWHLSQGDLEAMSLSLGQCAEDVWCIGYQKAVTKQFTNLEGVVDARLAAEYALSFELFDSWSEIASVTESEGLRLWTNLLNAEQSLYAKDWDGAAQILEQLQSDSTKTLRVDLWNQRLNPSAPQTVETSIRMANWKTASLQTQGAWALEQAGAWLSTEDPQSFNAIEAWVQAGQWFEGDVPDVMLKNRFQLIRSQSAIQQNATEEGIRHLTKIQSSFSDPLLQFWQGVQWVQLDRLRNASSIAESMSADTPHHWMLKVVIAIQSNNPEMLKQSLDAIAQTDLSLLSERTMLQTWIPPFNWRPVLERAQSMVKSGSVPEQYLTVLYWLQGDDPTVIPYSEGWATGWLVGAQYAYSRKDFDVAHRKVERFRRLMPDSVTGEILSQLINIQIGRLDIAQRELGLIAQRERSAVWGAWLYRGFTAVDAVDSATDAYQRWYPTLPVRCVSAEHPLLFDELPHE